MQDATVWRAMCEKLKFAQDDVEGDATILQMMETIEMACHVEAHPVAVIHYARTQMDRKMFDLETLAFMRSNLLEHAELDAKDVPPPPDSPDFHPPSDYIRGNGNPVTVPPKTPSKKRRLDFDEPTQRMTPESDDDADVDDKLRD